MIKFVLFCLLMNIHSSWAAPLCVAHRGLGFQQIENSLAAIESAVQAGVEAIEFDLLHTKDGETIIYHDNNLKRLVTGNTDCPIGKNISEIGSDELKNCELSNGESIPFFSEVMAFLSQYNTTLFIEVKDKVTKKDLEVLMNSFPDPRGKIVIISFKESILRQIKAHRVVEPYLQKIKLLLITPNAKKTSFVGLDGLDANKISKRLVKKYRSQGHYIGVYTKDTESEIKKEIKKGVDFITTNNYSLCKSLTY